MQTKKLIDRVDQLIQLGNQTLKATQYSKYSRCEIVDRGQRIKFRSAVLSFLEQVYGKGHSYYHEFNRAVAVSNFKVDSIKSGIEILSVIRSEIEGGWLISVKGLLRAEIFSDFLEMSDHLLSEGYKDASAVMIGGVLENHLRQLCRNNGIDPEIKKDTKEIPKKADQLNSELATAEVYNKLDQKMVTGWLDLRNKAAHGHYDQYTKEQVETMLNGVSEFASRIQ
jgi:hypothetical protein